MSTRGAIRALLLTSMLGAGCRGPSPRIAVSVGALEEPCRVSRVSAVLRLGDVACTLAAERERYTSSCEVPLQRSFDAVLTYAQEPGGLLLARAVRHFEPAPNPDETTLIFEPTDLDYSHDADNDGVPNIDEVCLGSDPKVADAPALLGVVHEEDAVGAPHGRYVVGERITLRGKHLPDKPEAMTIRIGPLREQGQGATHTLESLDLKLDPISEETLITVQVPAGLDTSAESTITVEVPGRTLTQKISVARAWAAGGRAKPELVVAAHGAFDLAKSPTRIPLVSDCGTHCDPTIWDISSDGRHLVLHASQRLYDIYLATVPTGRASVPLPIHPKGGLALTSAGALVALDDAMGLLSLFEVDWEKLVLRGGPAQDLPIPHAKAMVRGADRQRFYVYTDDGTTAAVRRVDLTAGKLGLSDRRVSWSGPCINEGCGGIQIREVTEDRVLVRRQDADDIALVDLRQGTHHSITIESPQWIAVTPSEEVLILHVKQTLPWPVFLCRLPVTGFAVGFTPICERPPNAPLGAPGSITVVPDHDLALVTAGFLNVATNRYALTTHSWGDPFSDPAAKPAPLRGIVVQP